VCGGDRAIRCGAWFLVDASYLTIGLAAVPRRGFGSRGRAMSQYKVMVDDNFDYMEEDERWEFGTFATAQRALAACRVLVDASLVGA
jgi:hypothetical protein